MTIQAKRLKAALKEVNAKSSSGGNLSVTTERTYCGRNSSGKACYEYGDAWSIVKLLNDQQCEKLKDILPYANLHHQIEYNYTIVTL